MVRSLRTVTLIAMRGDRDDVSVHPPGPDPAGMRTAGLVAGFCLAVAATVVVFLTEDPQVLRLAVVAAAWAFVLAALVASRRTADGAPVDGAARAAVERADLERKAAEREVGLHLDNELESEREVAARREHELRVENDLRRTTDQSVSTELEALRTELAQVAELRRDLAGLAELRTTLAGLDLSAVAELRTDVGRLRSELTEQSSGEMLVERVMLRTQSTGRPPRHRERPLPAPSRPTAGTGRRRSRPPRGRPSGPTSRPPAPAGRRRCASSRSGRSHLRPRWTGWPGAH